MTMRTYLDHNASAPLLPEARSAMVEALAHAGNPSSVHAEGRALRKFVEDARASLAAAIGCAPRQVVFTSGATEAANHALSPVLRKGGREVAVSRLYVSAIEHPCVLRGGRFGASAVETLPVTEAGVVDLAALERALARHDRDAGAPMVSLMLANNETGAIQPIAEAARLVRAAGGYLVVDAVQAMGRIGIPLASFGADFLLLSSHKIGGPQGAGALILGDPELSPVPHLRGGGQERGHRPGTENVAAIAGFGAAAAAIPAALAQTGHVARLRDSIEDGLRTISRQTGNRVGEPVFFGAGGDRLPNTSCFAVPGIRAETALIALDLAGVAVSSGSACSSGRVAKSHVLAAMGVEDEIAACALRLSLGRDSVEADAGRFLAAWTDIAGRAAARM